MADITKEQIIDMLKYLINLKNKYEDEESNESEYSSSENDYEGGYGAPVGALKNKYLTFVSKFATKRVLPAHSASHLAKLQKVYKAKKKVHFN